MYCGETIDFQNSELIKAPAATLQTMALEYNQALANISSLVNRLEQLLPQFTKSNYRTSFENYVQTGISVLQPIEQYAAVSDVTMDKVAEETAGTLMEVIASDITGTKGGLMNSSKKERIDQYRFFLAVYTVPMILHLNYNISIPLADAILEKWRQNFPDFAFHKARYEELQSGFERKGLCYITTAVCETMDKPDNCYELTTMRNFRDTYMQQTKERQALVEEYYRTAPAIVTFINIQPSCEEKYLSIWKKYLQPCLYDIEENNLEQCEKRYTGMVQDLKSEYNISFI
jgi:hypothetical protein